MHTKFFYKNIELAVLQGVFEPSEDSLLLADCLKKSDAKGKIALDMGCGSGLQGINAFLLGAKKVFFADIDGNAVANARQNAKALGFSKIASFKKTNLFSALKGKRFDLIVFNPPYVDSGVQKKWLDTDGGKKGREVLDAFLKQAKKHLGKNGLLFFVQSSLNGEQKTKKILKEAGFEFEVVAQKRLFFEELVVFRAEKKQ